MVYLSGMTDPHVAAGDLLDPIVELGEARAAEIEAAEQVAEAAE